MKSVRYSIPIDLMGRTNRKFRRSKVKKYRNGWLEFMFWMFTSGVAITAAALVTNL